jgi:hypothetical protein
LKYKKDKEIGVYFEAQSGKSKEEEYRNNSKFRGYEDMDSKPDVIVERRSFLARIEDESAETKVPE